MNETETEMMPPGLMGDDTHRQDEGTATHPFGCKDCGWVGHNQRSLAMHWKRKHGPNAESWTRSTTKNLRMARKAKRGKRGPYKRRNAEVSATNGVTTKVGLRSKSPNEARRVNYCPECGCHLGAVEMALNFNPYEETKTKS